ncbi:MFS transporter [Rhizobium lusitanum]|uniref:MFS transporter n=1 Tax=Rhizobium lusitanum TaxID=293958 RepID=A0A6L9UEH9_9HYPH|nr:MFS transporter [Rhizobium lusitanum]NEI74383.1 MFS transporter [Rhizobium lusitanum]
MVVAHSAARAASRIEGWKLGALVFLAFAQLIYSLDINIVFVALPKIGKGLGFSSQTLQWVISAYMVLCGGMLLLGGRAADLMGQRRMFIFALYLYAVSSFAGGLAWSPAVVVTARAVQGIGAAFLFPATLSLVNRLFVEGAERNKALAVWGGAGASGLTIGALAGGFLTALWGWPAIFFVNVVLAAIVIAGAVAFIPKDRLSVERRGFDLPGALTATAGATLLVFSLVQGPEFGWTTPAIVWSLVLCAALLVLFVFIEAMSVVPLMPLRLFRNRNVVGGAIITFLYMASFGALPYFETVLFQDVQHFTALQTGFAFVAPSVAIMAGTQFGARMATRQSSRRALFTGILIGAVGTVMLALAATAEGHYLHALPGLVVSGIGQGIVWTAMWIMAATGVRDEEQGIASGIASTTLSVGNAVGLAVLIATANGRSLALEHDYSSEVATASGIQLALLFAAVGMILCVVPTLIGQRRI